MVTLGPYTMILGYLDPEGPGAARDALEHSGMLPGLPVGCSKSYLVRCCPTTWSSMASLERSYKLGR